MNIENVDHFIYGARPTGRETPNILGGVYFKFDISDTDLNKMLKYGTKNEHDKLIKQSQFENVIVSIGDSD